MFAASKTAAVSGAAPDSQFNYVTMLLHGDGTNGAQNNTFVDSSTNNFTITRNGNTTQGSFSPYGSNWSVGFNLVSTPDYFTVASNAAFGMGTGDYTIESWFYCTDSGGYQPIIDCRSATPATGQILFRVYATGQFYFSIQGSGTVLTSPANIATNTWVHAAVVKASGVYTLYINGTSVATASNSVSIPTSPVTIGYDSQNGNGFLGYLSNVRIVKGVAVYTGNFTPSTTPLTAVSGTSLLTCQSNRFVDNSSNAFAITVNNAPSVQRFNPFGTSTAYSTSVIGGSAYYDGTGDSLSTPASSANIPQSGDDYTVEAWIYLTAAGNVTSIYSGDGSGYFAYRSVGRFEFVSGALELRLTYTAPLNRWCHVAVTRQSGTVRMFVDGVLTSPTAVSGTVTGNTDVLITGTTYYFGSYTNSTSGPFYGYISNFRIVKGTAVYTAAFTPPTAPLTAVTNTAILLNNTNGAIYDNAMVNNLETVGNAQISTSVKKYGTGSLAFDGSGDWLIMPYGPTQNFGTGSFTIEGWFYLNSLAASYYVPCGTWGSGTSDEWLIQIRNDGYIRFLTTAGSTFYSASITTATWYHIAIVRNGSTINIYVNGTSVGSYTCTNSLGSTAKTLYIGTQAGTWDWNGYIDDFRITNGYARYTANFTAPTAAFSDKGPN